MVLPRYLAQTAAEMAGNPIADKCAFLACHFSPGGKGLSNLPDCLPPGAMLILDDSMPLDGHKPDLILTQLSSAIQRHRCEALLLDFQRPEQPPQQELARQLCSSLPCPVGVSELYTQGLSCPVFLPPIPPDQSLASYLAPWKNREVWLEIALDGITLTLTEAGSSTEPLRDFPEEGLTDENLRCHYTIETAADAAIFRLWRTKTDLDKLLVEAESQGVAKAIGLWQELG